MALAARPPRAPLPSAIGYSGARSDVCPARPLVAQAMAAAAAEVAADPREVGPLFLVIERGVAKKYSVLESFGAVSPWPYMQDSIRERERERGRSCVGNSNQGVKNICLPLFTTVCLTPPQTRKRI